MLVLFKCRKRAGEGSCSQWSSAASPECLKVARGTFDCHSDWGVGVLLDLGDRDAGY